MLRNPASCPLCRQRVTTLIRCFDVDSAEAVAQRDRIMEYNDRHTRSTLARLREVPSLIRRLASHPADVWRLLGSVPRTLFALACVVYILSPLDLIPDAIPVVGLLDDLFVVAMLLLRAALLYRFLLVQGRHWRRR